MVGPMRLSRERATAVQYEEMQTGRGLAYGKGSRIPTVTRSQTPRGPGSRCELSAVRAKSEMASTLLRPRWPIPFPPVWGSKFPRTETKVSKPGLHPTRHDAAANTERMQPVVVPSSNEEPIPLDELSDPELQKIAAAVNVTALKIWEPQTWSQRTSVLSRYVAFLAAHQLPSNHQSIALFVGSLHLKPSSALQYAGILKRCVDKPPDLLEMYMKGLRKEKAMTPVRQAKAMSYEDYVTIRNALKNPGDALMFRVAWLTASRWSDVEFLPPSAFQEHMVDPSLLIVDFWYHPKTFKSESDRPDRYVVIGGQDAEVIRAYLKNVLRQDEPIAQKTTAQMGQLLKPYGYTAHSIKRGALEHAAKKIFQQMAEKPAGPNSVSTLGKHGDNPEAMSRSTTHYLQAHTALLTGTLATTSLMAQTFRPSK